MAARTLRNHLDTTDTVRVMTRKADGAERVTPIWSVVADGQPYLRSVDGSEGWWYRRAVARGWVAFEIDGERVEASVEEVEDAATLSAVDEAYRAKYGRFGSSLDAMLTDTSRPATIHLVAQQA